MTRLRIWLDGKLRLDEPAGRADTVRLNHAIDFLELDCLAHNRRLAVVATCGNVECVLVRI